MSQKTKAKGISLIVLVITIIIIIILAGAVILSLNNSNIIAKAKEAKESNDLTGIREAVEAEKANVMLSGGTANVTIPDAYSSDIYVSDIGGIFLKPNATPKITNVENAIKELGAAYLPTGFDHVEGTLEEGIVIQDSEGNQFVWIPVNNISEFIRVADFSAGTWAAIGGSDIAYNSVSATEKAEYDAMVASVTKYKGFYIARYEAGKPTGTGLTGGTTTGLDKDGTDKPVSTANVTVWNNIEWDSVYDSGNLGVDTNKGTVKVARAMYPDNVNYTTYGLTSGINTTGVISTLIYGEQWDAAMRYMKDIPNPNVSNSKYITNSTKIGNYSDSDSNNNPAKTGDNRYTAYKVKNIYDMAGNVYEWTMEVYNVDTRVFRGGAYYYDGTTKPASYRNGMGAHGGSSYLGLRVALYIK